MANDFLKAIEDLILKAVLPQLDVTVSPEKWVFVSKGKRVEVATFIYLKDDRVVSVGKEAPGLKRVDLFAADIMVTGPDRQECLVAFFRYSVAMTVGVGFLKPRVRFLNIKSLQTCTGGYAKTILQQMAHEAYMTKVEFVGFEKDKGTVNF